MTEQPEQPVDPTTVVVNIQPDDSYLGVTSTGPTEDDEEN